MADNDFNFETSLPKNTKVPKIRLWHTGGIGLIIPHSSGIIYTNQTGGHGCYHPELEGMYVPLVDDLNSLQKPLYDYFTGPKWNGWCIPSTGIDKETANFIDKILHGTNITNFISVDRNSLKESHEAWVKVILDKKKLGSDLPIVGNLDKSWGILTWENSD